LCAPLRRAGAQPSLSHRRPSQSRWCGKLRRLAAGKPAFSRAWTVSRDRAIAIGPVCSYMRPVRDFAWLVAAREGLLHNTPNPDL
jgi:hypothetical protein